MTDDLVSRARDLAHRAHAGQVDKAGRPYIEHVARVAAAVRSAGRCSNDDCCRGEIIDHDSVGCSDPSCCSLASRPCHECNDAEAVAWLHDVLEDCPDEGEALFGLVPLNIYGAVSCLTRWLHLTPTEYYRRIRSNPLALRVKLADISDNGDESRLALLDKKTADRLRRKYRRAIDELMGDGDDR